MRHARADYNRIQDPENLIGEDEPVFLMRAHDLAAPDAVRAWAEIAAEVGSQPEVVERAYAWADVMEEWQADNDTKAADMPEDA